DPGFQLLCDILGNEAGIQFRTLDLAYIDLDFFAGDLLQLFTEQLDLLTTLSDNHTGTGGIEGKKYPFWRPFNDDVGEPAIFKPCPEVFSQTGILMKHGRFIL